MSEKPIDCPLCEPHGERVLWEDARCRIIRVDDPLYAGFCRVIWHPHIAEMTDLQADDQAHFMACVLATEAVIRALFAPAKINLASLGNMVPHLHWHVIARFADDAHFPDAVWAAAKREPGPQPVVTDEALIAALHERIGRMDD